MMLLAPPVQIGDTGGRRNRHTAIGCLPQFAIVLLGERGEGVELEAT